MQSYRPEDYPSGLSIFKSALFIVFFTGADSSWAMSQSRAMTTAFSPAKWRELGLIALNVS